jgi:hypothetical protein
MRLIFMTLIFVFGCYVAGSTGESFTVKGKIYVSGNEPFTELAIQSENGKVYLISKNSPVYGELWKNQGNVVVVEVTKTETAGMEKGKIFVKSFKVISK